jgi:hypothetical protein
MYDIAKTNKSVCIHHDGELLPVAMFNQLMQQ